MRLLVAGGTGFIGKPLCRFLVQRGHEVLVVTRDTRGHIAKPGLRYLPWDTSEWQRAIADVHGIINLCGEPIAARPWSEEQKRRLQESRVQTTRRLIDAVKSLSSRKPSLLINASAIGYYGSRGDERLTEQAVSGPGFLAEICRSWEAEAKRAEALGMRVIRLRVGLVVAPGGGALAKMLPPFRAFVGGPVGNGRQWISWIHRDDVVGLIDWLLGRQEISGAVNATAPEPVTMKQFCRELGRALHRPSWMPVPAPILRLALGEMAELLLTGQRVIPQVALDGAYPFKFMELASAFQASLIEDGN